MRVGGGRGLRGGLGGGRVGKGLEGKMKVGGGKFGEWVGLGGCWRRGSRKK